MALKNNTLVYEEGNQEEGSSPLSFAEQKINSVLDSVVSYNPFSSTSADDNLAHDIEAEDLKGNLEQPRDRKTDRILLKMSDKQHLLIKMLTDRRYKIDDLPILKRQQSEKTGVHLAYIVDWLLYKRLVNW